MLEAVRFEKHGHLQIIVAVGRYAWKKCKEVGVITGRKRVNVCAHLVIDPGVLFATHVVCATEERKVEKKNRARVWLEY